MAATTAVVVAAATASVVAVSTASTDCCCRLLGRRRKGLKQNSEASRLPLIGTDAPEVKCRLHPSKPVTGPCRIAIVKDLLVIGRQPGEAEDSVLLTAAKIVLKGTTVLIQPRLTPPLTLHFGSVPEAERWAERLRTVAGMHEQRPAGHGENDAQRAQTARIAELEARVSATLHAAVDRSKRIKELEATIEEGKERDLRIKELEEAVEETMQEASARGERIKELEGVLASRGAIPDAAASAVLEDAMHFAEQMLENRGEEMAIDGEGAQGLQEAVEAVQKAKPAVDGDVAELVSKLVTALRWPMVLRRRLVDAEQTVKEQKEIQDHTLQELRDLQKQHATSEHEKAIVEAEVISLKRQLTMAERTAEEAVGRLEEIHSSGGVGQPALGDQPQQEAKRLQAEALSRELREKLALAEKAVADSAVSQKAQADEVHRAELEQLQRKHDDTDAARQAAQAHATELREMLVVAERHAEDAVAEQREVLERAHAEDLLALQQLRTEADAQRSDAEERANELRRQLVMTEQAIDSAATREKQLLDEQLQEELGKLQQERELARSQRDDAALQANELQSRLEAAERAAKQATEQAASQSISADKKREFAELQAIALKQRLVDAEQAFDESMRSHKALTDSAHVQELQDLQERHANAQKERDLAEERAAKLSDELAVAQHASDQHVAQKYQALDAAREDEVTSVRRQHAKAEAMIGEVEMRACELREKLASAETALQSKASRQRDLLNTERFMEPSPATGTKTGGMDVLDEIKREKARIVDLESRLADSVAKSSWAGSTTQAAGPTAATHQAEAAPAEAPGRPGRVATGTRPLQQASAEDLRQKPAQVSRQAGAKSRPSPTTGQQQFAAFGSTTTHPGSGWSAANR